MASKYLKNLRRDLPRWAEQGLVKPSHIEAILADAETQKSSMPLANIVALLGAILLCFALITLVAANWQAIPRLTKLLLLFATLWTTYFATWLCFKKEMTSLGHSALLIASATFGANIMLIAQMYHMQGDAPVAVLIWACGALLAATLIRSTPSLILAILLFGTWTFMRAEPFSHDTHYPFLLAWLITALIVKFRVTSRLSAHLLVIVLMAWLFSASNFGLFFVRQSSSLLTIWTIPVLLFSISALIQSSRKKQWLGGFEIAAIAYLLIFLFTATFLIQFYPDYLGDRIDLIAQTSFRAIAYQRAPFLLVIVSALVFGLRARKHGEPWSTHAMIAIWAIAVAGLISMLASSFSNTIAWASLAASLVIILSIWTIRIGDRLHAPAIKAVGFASFIAEIFYIYFKTIGGFLGTTLLFFFGGAIMIIAAIIFMRRAKKREKSGAENG